MRMERRVLLAGLCIGLAAGPSTCAAASGPHFQEQAYRYKDCDGKPAIARVPLFADGTEGAGTRINNYIHMAFLQAAPPLKPSATPLSLGKGSFFDGRTENFSARVADAIGGRASR